MTGEDNSALRSLHTTTAAKMVRENCDRFTELLEKDIAAVIVPAWMIAAFLQLCFLRLS